MKKSFTLVEVLVSLAIFSILAILSISIYTSITVITLSQKDYIYLESICLDIDKYYDKYDSNWDNQYYGFNPSNNRVYYDSNYQVSDDSDYKFILDYKYEDSNLVVTITNTKKNKTIIDNLEYGVSKSR